MFGSAGSLTSLNSPRTRICHWRCVAEAITEPDSAYAMIHLGTLACCRVSAINAKWRAQRRDRSTWEEEQGGHSMRTLNTASASFLLASATESISLDKISH